MRITARKIKKLSGSEVWPEGTHVDRAEANHILSRENREFPLAVDEEQLRDDLPYRRRLGANETHP